MLCQYNIIPEKTKVSHLYLKLNKGSLVTIKFHSILFFLMAPSDLSPEVVTQYLRQNPDVLDKIVASDLVHADRLKEWVHRKSKQNHDQEQSPGQNDLRERSDNSVLSRAGCGTDRHKHSAHAQFAMENGKVWLAAICTPDTSELSVVGVDFIERLRRSSKKV